MAQADGAHSGPSGVGAEPPNTISRHFDLTSTPYDDAFDAAVRSRRSSYPEGLLFVERLLQIGSIDSSLYPPNTPAGARRLLNAVFGSDLDRSRQDCFYYYFLRDYDQASAKRGNGSTNGGLEVDMMKGERADTVSKAMAFASARCLTKPWVVMMDAFWYLDNGEWELAVDALVDPRITELNFAEEIVDVLLSHVSPPPRALAYIQQLVQTTPHIPQTDAILPIRLFALASTSSLDDAFKFIRSAPTEKQSSLREELWCFILGAPRIRAGAGQHTPQGDRIKELVHIPLDQEELDHLISFLARPPKGVAQDPISVLHDLVTLRLVHQGQYAEAIQLDRDSAGPAGKDADRQRRREMVREFISILPDVQRRVLAIEGDDRAIRRAADRDAVVVPNGNYSETKTTAPSLAPPITNGYAAEVPPKDSLHPASLGARDDRQDTPSPAPTPRSRKHSPFTGPPRFASVQQSSPGLLHRVLSGPFALPRQPSRAGSPASSKPQRRIIEDDITGSARPPRHSGRLDRPRQVSATETEHSLGDAEDHDMEDDDRSEPHDLAADNRAVAPLSPPATAPRRSRRVVSASKQSSAEEKPEPPAPTPASPPAAKSAPPPKSPAAARAPRTRRSARSSSSGHTPMPGAFEATPHPEPVPENEVLDVPPTPRNIGNGQPSTQSRARTTRSASRALLEEDEEEGGKARGKKRAKTTREESVPITPTRTRRSTRASTRASSAIPSEMGSPTPSVVSNAGGRNRRNVRGTSVASQIPRQTRSRK